MKLVNTENNYNSKCGQFEQIQGQFNKQVQQNQTITFQYKMNEDKYRRKLMDLEQKYKELYADFEKQQIHGYGYGNGSKENNYLEKLVEEQSQMIRQKDQQIQECRKVVARLEKQISNQDLYEDGQLFMLFENLSNYQDFIQNKNIFINQIDNHYLLVNEI